MHFRHINRYWLLPLLALLCIGWAGSWEELKSTAGTVNSVRAEFIQEKHLAILAKPLISEGVFYYQAPRSLRWQYIRPVESVLLMHEGNIKRYVKRSTGFEEENNAGLEAMQVVLDQITQWMMGRFDESPMFNAHLEEAGRITMTPKDEAFKAIIQRIEINLAKRPGVIEDVVIYEGQDAYTRMRFINTTLNGKIDDAVFRKVP